MHRHHHGPSLRSIAWAMRQGQAGINPNGHRTTYKSIQDGLLLHDAKARRKRDAAEARAARREQARQVAASRTPQPSDALYVLIPLALLLVLLGWLLVR